MTNEQIALAMIESIVTYDEKYFIESDAFVTVNDKTISIHPLDPAIPNLVLNMDAREARVLAARLLNAAAQTETT